MLSYSQAAEALGVSPRSVRRLVKSGELPAAKVGGSVRIREDALQRFVYESEKRMASDVSSSLVGNNDFGGGPRDVPISAAFPGNGAPAESGLSTGGASWQSWQTGDDLVGDEPTVNRQPGHVSGGIIGYPEDSADPFPGARPPGTQGEISPTAPACFVDAQSNATDYDVGPDRDLSSPSRPWSSGVRPSDTGFTSAFFDSTGQIPQGVPDSTGTTGPRRLRRDDGAPGILP
jgi:excisionase family DNA binding protein